MDTKTLIELLEMADMYAHKCTMQEEKFADYQRNGIRWRWVDCQAAHTLLNERGDYYQLRRMWITAKIGKR